MSATHELDADISALVLEQADRLFRQHVTKERLDEADRGVWQGAIWRAVADAGLPLALVPEAQGGIGLAPVTAMRLIRRAAWHTLPLPLGEAMVAAGLWAAASGEAVEGALSLAPAGSFLLRGGPAGHTLDGEAPRVPWGGQVDAVLVHAQDADGEACLALVPRAAFRVVSRRNLANEPRDTLIAEEVRLPDGAVRPAPRLTAEGFLAAGALLRAQQMVGAMERCLDFALGYANERVQFGRPIGKFQAVQHMLADAAGHYAAATAAADLGAEACEAWGAETEFAAAVAKARTGEAAGRVAEICHQVHGAMGFTQEHPLHFSTRRLWSWRDEFGREAYWQERIGRMVCAQGGEALWPRLAGG